MITAHSKMGQGTTMSVFLPAGGEPDGINKQENDIKEAVPMVKSGGSILLLDDDPSVHKTAEAMLEELGYTVAHAMDGEEAINRYRDSMKEGAPFDAVILDLTIPGGMSGREAAESLTREFPDVRTIVSSGYSTDPVMAEYEKYGFLGKVEKPYNLSQLAETIHFVLGKA
jgi:CheY-like chemotaxis protein